MTTSSLESSQDRDRWLLRIVSADPKKETEFDLCLTLDGQSENNSGLTFGVETTPYEQELDRNMILAVVASKSDTQLSSELRQLDGDSGVGVTSLRQILGKQVVDEKRCFGRGF